MINSQIKRKTLGLDVVVLGGASADGQGQQESWPEPHPLQAPTG